MHWRWRSFQTPKYMFVLLWWLLLQATLTGNQWRCYSDFQEVDGVKVLQLETAAGAAIRVQAIRNKDSWYIPFGLPMLMFLRYSLALSFMNQFFNNAIGIMSLDHDSFQWKQLQICFLSRLAIFLILNLGFCLFAERTFFSWPPFFYFPVWSLYLERWLCDPKPGQDKSFEPFNWTGAWI